MTITLNARAHTHIRACLRMSANAYKTPGRSTRRIAPGVCCENDGKGGLVFAARGTCAIHDAWTNAKCWLTRCKVYDGRDKENKKEELLPGLVHAGFDAVATSWCAAADRYIQAQDPSPDQITFSGHSLGGAVALLAACKLRVPGCRVHVITFGAPMAGNAAFAAHCDATLDTHYRIVLHDDIVPLLPRGCGWWDYRHAGSEFVLRTCTYRFRHFTGSYARGFDTTQQRVFLAAEQT